MNQQETNLTNQQEVQVLDKNDIPIPKKEDLKKVKKRKIPKRILFAFIWLYLVVRMIITDIDLFIVRSYYEINPVLYVTLRLLILSFIVLAIWIKIGNKKFWKNFGNFLLFPLYPGLFNILKVLLWGIPSKLINNKKTSLLYNYIEWYLDFFFNFKKSLIVGIVFLLSFISLFTLESHYMLIPIGLFTVLQILHLKRRYNETYEPIKIFQIKLNLSDPERDESVSPEKLKAQFEKVTEDVKKREKENVDAEIIEMERLLLMSEFSKAFNAKTKDILNTRSYLKSFIWKAIYSLLLSMVFFGGINYSLYIFDSSNFKIDFIPSYFDFFYYSFFTIIPDGTDIEPITATAKSIRMVGVVIGIVINLLVLAVYFSVSNDKYKENLEKILRYTEIYSTEISNHYKEKYGQEPADGIKKLKVASSALKSIEAIRKLFSLPKK